MKTKINALCVLLVMSFVSSSIIPHPAYAGERNREYKSLCNGDAESGKLGENTKLECSKAKELVKAKDVEVAKLAFLSVSMAAAIAGLIMEQYPVTVSAGKAMCTALDYGVPLTTIGMELIAEKQFKADMATSLAPLALKFAMGGGSEIAKHGFFGTKDAEQVKSSAKTLAKDKNKTTEDKKSASCAMTIVGIAIPTLMSKVSLDGDQKSIDAEFETIRALKDTKKTDIDTGPNLAINNRNVDNPTGNRGVSPNNEGTESTDPCDSGSSYDCIKTAMPELAAIMNSPEINSNLQKATGKNFQDLMNAAQGETPAEMMASVASQAGLSDAMKSVTDNAEKVAKDINLMKDYKPLAYTRSPAKAATSRSGDLDFSKLMADMLKNMNPEAAKEKTKDPSELVFRQLDLLPPEKIEQNKDISLFARVGYRYRKNLSNVEQLNWSQ
jgi:hypothetical protein